MSNSTASYYNPFDEVSSALCGDPQTATDLTSAGALGATHTLDIPQSICLINGIVVGPTLAVFILIFPFLLSRQRLGPAFFAFNSFQKVGFGIARYHNEIKRYRFPYGMVAACALVAGLAPLLALAEPVVPKGINLWIALSCVSNLLYAIVCFIKRKDRFPLPDYVLLWQIVVAIASFAAVTNASVLQDKGFLPTKNAVLIIAMYINLFAVLVNTLIATVVLVVGSYSQPETQVPKYETKTSRWNCCRRATTTGTEGSTGETISLLSPTAAARVPLAPSAAEVEAAKGTRKYDSPLDSASVLSRLTFYWMNPIMKLGYARPLESSDLPDVPSDDATTAVQDKFESAWQEAESKSSDTPSVSRTLVRAFGSTFAAAAVFKLSFDVFQVLGPMLLSCIIQFLDDTAAGLEPPAWLGFAYVGLLLVSSIVQTLLLHQYFLRVFKVGQNVRAALILAIYRKALRLSLNARQKLNTGTINNLMSTDSKRMQDLQTYLMTVLSGPWQIALALILLWQQIGVSVLAGLGVMILFLPVNGLLARRAQKLQGALMKIKDKRISLTSEVLQGFRLMKFNAWEGHFLKQITEIRNSELARLLSYQFLNQIGSIVWMGLPLIVTLASFGTYTLINNHPPPTTNLFTALSLFNLLRFPLAMFPSVISNIVEAQVSIKRLQDFFKAEELDPEGVARVGAGSAGDASPVEYGHVSLKIRKAVAYQQGAVHVDNAAARLAVEGDPSLALAVIQGSFAWDTSPTSFSLNKVSVSAYKGDYVAIVGPVGAGKTTLLHAMLGELTRLSGSVAIRGSVAYASQSTFILNATVKENITFGHRFEVTRYEAILDACSLRPDLAILPAGDETEIGEKGINLSGGQQARVALARAVYADADIYLLDDVLSAVDAHVGAHIFRQCINGLLKKKTRIMVTHGLQYIAPADNILVMKDGDVVEHGKYNDLVTNRQGPILVGLMETYNTDKTALAASLEGAADGEASPPGSPAGDEKKLPTAATPTPKANARQMALETRAKGQLKRTVFVQYINALGGWPVAVLVTFLFVAFQSSSMGASAWLSAWSNNSATLDAADNMQYLGIYAAISVGSLLTLVAMRLYVAYVGVRAARSLHESLINRILFVPLSFIDTTPIGRILNRFSQDVYVADEQLPDTYSSFMGTFLSVLGTVVLISVITPYFLLALIPLTAFYVYTQRYYVASSRELQRLDSVSRSPIFANFSETLSGCVTIRAFGQSRRFALKNQTLLQDNQAAYFMYTTSNRWLAVRLETVSTCITAGSAFLAVIARNSGGDFPSLAGLSISTALALTQTLNWLVRMASDSESQSVSVERLKEYSDLPVESMHASHQREPPATWPQKGSIAIQDLRLHYRRETPAVLQNISCSINAKEHVGIVGRTGAGKSSLVGALFLTADVIDGSVVIDGIDTKHVPLETLRSRLTLIPQNPILFSGTIRRNLDMLDQFKDEELWAALDLVQMKGTVEKLGEGLLATVADGGSNFSAGQRQLLTVARALLKRSRIVILDEASSSVDVQSDVILQAAIRKEFADSTVLTIAHRINTILDSDRIMLLDSGRILEYDKPDVLLANPRSSFASLVAESAQHAH